MKYTMHFCSLLIISPLSLTLGVRLLYCNYIGQIHVFNSEFDVFPKGHVMKQNGNNSFF